MSKEKPLRADGRNLVQRYPVTSYFASTYVISWAGALIVAAPHLMRHEDVPKMTGLSMFPVMLLGPSGAAILLTRIADGREGLRDLFLRMIRVRAGAWYGTLLIPPAVIVSVLFLLEKTASPVFAPNLFLAGLAFGVPAGLLEEIGWTGYAFPKMCARQSAVRAAILLGMLWGAWHLPVIDYLGTATPHGRYWFPYFCAFVLAMTAMRVLIAWTYTNTESVTLAQLMHISSTGSLVVFSPNKVDAELETLWFLVYALALWIVVAVVANRYGAALNRT